MEIVKQNKKQYTITLDKRECIIVYFTDKKVRLVIENLKEKINVNHFRSK